MTRSKTSFVWMIDCGFDKKVDNLPPDKYAIERKAIEILEESSMSPSKYPLMRHNILREDLDALLIICAQMIQC